MFTDIFIAMRYLGNRQGCKLLELFVRISTFAEAAHV